MPWIEIFQFFLHIFIIWVKLSIFGEKKFEKSFIFAEKIEFENSVFFTWAHTNGTRQVFATFNTKNTVLETVKEWS